MPVKRAKGSKLHFAFVARHFLFFLKPSLHHTDRISAYRPSVKLFRLLGSSLFNVKQSRILTMQLRGSVCKTGPAHLGSKEVFSQAQSSPSKRGGS